MVREKRFNDELEGGYLVGNFFPDSEMGINFFLNFIFFNMFLITKYRISFISKHYGF